MIIWLILGAIVICFGLIVLRGAPYVPTHRHQLRIAFDELYPVSDHDTVVDLGSGDGIVLREAASRGAAVVGYELNPILVLLSKWRLRNYPLANIFMRDFLSLDILPDNTTVVYAFTTGRNIEAIGKKIEQWSDNNDLHLISYGFTLANHKPLKSVGPMHLYHFKRH